METNTENFKLKKSELNPLLFCIMIALVQMIGIDMYLPSMPYIAENLHTSQTVIQLTIAFYVLGATVSALFSGPLSDKMGRKPMIMIGMIGMFIGAILCLFAPNGSFLLFGRVIQGIGSGFCISANRAVISDTFSAKKIPLVGAYFSAITSISPIIAPIAGGYLEHYYNWRANFLVLSIVYFFTLSLFLPFFKETISAKHPDKLSILFIIKRYKQLITQADFTIYALCGGAALGVSVAYATNAAFIFQNMLGVSPIAFGWLGIFIGFGNIFGKMTNASLVKYFDMKNILITGIVIILFSGVVLLLLSTLSELSIATTLIIVMITLFGQIYVMNSAFSLGITPYRHMGGSANALLSAGQMLLSFLISSVLSFSANHISESVSLAMAYMAIGGFCLLIFLPYFLRYDPTPFS